VWQVSTGKLVSCGQTDLVFISAQTPDHYALLPHGMLRVAGYAWQFCPWHVGFTRFVLEFRAAMFVLYSSVTAVQMFSFFTFVSCRIQGCDAVR
jgi:hypothetical protein